MIPTLITGTISCKKETIEEAPTEQKVLASKTFNYEFNNGQIISTSSYGGMHQDNLTAQMQIDELANGKAK
jgi:hypothetical protein